MDYPREASICTSPLAGNCVSQDCYEHCNNKSLTASKNIRQPYFVSLLRGLQIYKYPESFTFTLCLPSFQSSLYGLSHDLFPPTGPDVCPRWSAMTDMMAVGGLLHETAVSDVECIDYCLYGMDDCVAAQVYNTSPTGTIVCVTHTDSRDLRFIYPLSGARLYLIECTGNACGLLSRFGFVFSNSSGRPRVALQVTHITCAWSQHKSQCIAIRRCNKNKT